MKKFLYIFGLVLPILAQAHPTSYEDSFGLMGEHSPNLSHNQFNYSWKYWLATGVHYYRQPLGEDSRQAAVFSTNFLLKRWNKHNLQANLYALGGVGYSDFRGDGDKTFLVGAQFDIEDRDYYFLAKHKNLLAASESDFRATTLRAGFTPYVDGFDGIHSWIILDVTESKFYGQESFVEYTPTLRVFYQNMLFEIGYSYSGNMNFNYITHF